MGRTEPITTVLYMHGLLHCLNEFISRNKPFMNIPTTTQQHHHMKECALLFW